MRVEHGRNHLRMQDARARARESERFIQEGNRAPVLKAPRDKSNPEPDAPCPAASTQLCQPSTTRARPIHPSTAPTHRVPLTPPAPHSPPLPSHPAFLGQALG